MGSVRQQANVSESQLYGGYIFEWWGTFSLTYIFIFTYSFIYRKSFFHYIDKFYIELVFSLMREVSSHLHLSYFCQEEVYFSLVRVVIYRGLYKGGIIRLGEIVFLLTIAFSLFLRRGAVRVFFRVQRKQKIVFLFFFFWWGFSLSWRFLFCLYGGHLPLSILVI